MARNASLAAIANPLVSSKQLLNFQQIPADAHMQDSLLFRSNLLTQVAGVLLRLPQEVIATSIIILQRYLVELVITAFDRGSNIQDHFYWESPWTQASAAAIYVSAKQSLYPLSPRSVVNVYALITSHTVSPLSFINPKASEMASLQNSPDAQSYFVSEGTYQTRREELFAEEKRLLCALGFDLKVSLPYSIALTYLQALSASSPELSERVLAYLNSALLSPQLLYLTHQPNALALASIYLVAREHNLSLVDEQVPWWEVFDVSREELGFLVLSLGSIRNFADAQEA